MLSKKKDRSLPYRLHLQIVITLLIETHRNNQTNTERYKIKGMVFLTPPFP